MFAPGSLGAAADFHLQVGNAEHAQKRLQAAPAGGSSIMAKG